MKVRVVLKEWTARLQYLLSSSQIWVEQRPVNRRRVLFTYTCQDGPSKNEKWALTPNFSNGFSPTLLLDEHSESVCTPPQKLVSMVQTEKEHFDSFSWVCVFSECNAQDTSSRVCVSLTRKQKIWQLLAEEETTVLIVHSQVVKYQHFVSQAEYQYYNSSYKLIPQGH